MKNVPGIPYDAEIEIKVLLKSRHALNSTYTILKAEEDNFLKKIKPAEEKRQVYSPGLPIKVM